jgi:hypothetical protein
MSLLSGQSPAPLSGQVSALRSDSSSAQNLLMIAIGIQLALMLPSLASLVVDDRLLNGVSVWSKPLKFQASLIMMLGTLAILLPQIETTSKNGWGVWIACLVAAMMATGEILYITLQAARRRASHFNSETQIEALAYSLMGIGAALLVLSSLVLGLYLLTRPAADASRGLQLGGGWGLVLGSILTLVTAFALGSGQIGGPGHWVGGVRSDAGGLLLFGWSRSGGDLRVPHFFATHIMQALPILGVLLETIAPRLLIPGLFAGSLFSIAVVAGTFIQAVMGQPFF